jgi:hypothetical protein
VGQDVAQGLDEGLVGQAQVLIATPEEDDRTLAVGPAGHFGHQAGLAHARLATHEHQVGPALDGGRAPGLLEHLRLGRPVDEREALLAGECLR